MKLLFFDTETTGLDHKTNCIHEMSFIVDINGEAVERFTLNVRPYIGTGETKEEQKAIAISGKTIADLKRNPPVEVVFRELEERLSVHVDKYNSKDKFMPVGYNVRFDLDMFRALWLNRGDDYFGSWFWTPGIDVMAIAANLLCKHRHNMENFKLETVAKIIGCGGAGKYHGSAFDIEVTREMYYAIKSSVGDIDHVVAYDYAPVVKMIYEKGFAMLDDMPELEMINLLKKCKKVTKL